MQRRALAPPPRLATTGRRAGPGLRHARRRPGRRRGPTGTSRCTTCSRWTRSSRSRPTSRCCTRCAWRPSTTSSPPSGSATSRCPSGAGRPSRRPGSAATRTSTAASTCATTAPARPSCWSTTPTPRPRCSRRRSCSGTGCKDIHPDDDQWNSLHEKLVERWAEIAGRLPGDEVHFTWSQADSTGEDHVTVGYLQETAAEAGLDTVGLAIEDIGWDVALDRFVDLEEAPMAAVFKLYPWEWVLTDDFGKHVAAQPARDAVGRAAVEVAAVEQGAARRAVGDVPRPPQPAARVPRRPRDAHRVRAQAAAGPRGRQHPIVAPGHGAPDRRRLRRGGLRLPALRPAARVRRLPSRAGRLDRRRHRGRARHPRDVGLVTDDGAAFVPHRIPD